MERVDAILGDIAARQHGLVSRTQAIELGFSRDMIRRRIDAGRWSLVHRGVFRIAGSPLTWETRLLGSVLAAGPDAIASHRSAAVLWGLGGIGPGRAEISVPRHHKPRHLEARVHESTDLDLAYPVVRRGIHTTGLTRTLLDVGAVVSPVVLERCIDQAVRETAIVWPDLYDTLALHSRRGRNGCGRFRAVIEERFGDKVITDSWFEKLVRRLLHDAGLPEAISQHRVYDGTAFVAEVDLAYPDQLVAVELQSKAFHLNAEAFEHDKLRLNQVRLLGWNVLEFTWRFYVEQPAVLCAQVERALSGSGVSSAPI